MPLSNLLPDERLRSIYELDLTALRERGIQGIILDIDNTITVWGVDELPSEAAQFFQRVASDGFKVAFISNAKAEERRGLWKPLSHFPVVYDAGKPGAKGFRHLIAELKLDPPQLAVVGDQIFTDVLGAKRLGMYTVLVEPVGPDIKSFSVRLRRILERIILRYFRHSSIDT